MIFIWILFFQVAYALEARWLGVAGVALTDGQDSLIFDPVFTKPHLGHWLFNQRFKSDQDLVKEKLNFLKIVKAHGIFSSHTHFDHAIDVATVAQETKATVYGGDSLKKLIHFQNPNVLFKPMNDGESFEIGRFKITPLRRKHAAIKSLNDYEFLPGLIDEFQGNFYDYKEGEVWCFFIEHPEGNILIDQGGRPDEKLLPYQGKIQVQFLGVANKKSMDNFIHGIYKMGAKKIIPLHFDFFLLQSSWLETWILPGSDLEEIQAILKDQFIIPKLYEKIILP
jgi:L-ascorbate metabolism protein UlaG (beta-lactamase superfamily)